VSLADGAIDGLTDEVGMAGVAGGLLDEVQKDPTRENGRPSRSGCTDSWSRLGAPAATVRLRWQASP
jgi:hypothetical protein